MNVSIQRCCASHRQRGAQLRRAVLRLSPQNYHAIKVRDWWSVIVIATGLKAYEETGPVKVYRSPVPVALRINGTDAERPVIERS